MASHPLVSCERAGGSVSHIDDRAVGRRGAPIWVGNIRLTQPVPSQV